MGILLKIIASLNGLLKVLCLCIQIDSWWLTLIDSTHKTNQYDWHLFTLYVCDTNTYGCWNVKASCITANEVLLTGDTVTILNTLLVGSPITIALGKEQANRSFSQIDLNSKAG